LLYLRVRYGNDPTWKRKLLAVYISVPLLVVLVAVLVLAFYLRRRRKQGIRLLSIYKQISLSSLVEHQLLTSAVPLFASTGSKSNNTVNPQNELTGNGYGQSSLHLQNRRFTYRELEMITDGFKRVLGRGGFGYVYDGFLEDGTQVAVKLRSHSSNQGVKEFLAEVHSQLRSAI
jgi:hypothetical protein